MSTPAITERNRANAQHSTGPRTDAGKATASQNSRKHGLSIQRHILLPHEDPALYERLLADLRDIYQPQSRREDLAVEDIAQCRWALQRFDAAEAVALQQQTMRFTDDPDLAPCTVAEALAYCATALIDHRPDGVQFVEPNADYPTFERIQRYRAHWDRRHHRAITHFDQAQRARRQEAQERRQETHALRQEARQRQQQAEAIRKADRDAASTRRQEEFHDLRMALATQKLTRTQAHPAAPPAQQPADAWEQALVAYLQSPPPSSLDDFRHAAGFVSSPATDALPPTEAHRQPAIPGAL
jgi:hypothetical protein